MGCFLKNRIHHVWPPVIMRHLSCRYSFSRILWYFLKTGFTVVYMYIGRCFGHYSFSLGVMSARHVTLLGCIIFSLGVFSSDKWVKVLLSLPAQNIWYEGCETIWFHSTAVPIYVIAFIQNNGNNVLISNDLFMKSKDKFANNHDNGDIILHYPFSINSVIKTTCNAINNCWLPITRTLG